jgi:Domain of unknown function DUF29
MSTPTYEADFYAWTRAQADAIRAKDLARLDIVHLAAEIESLGIADEHAITRQLQRLLLHLLQWQYQPTHRGRSWRRSIDQARDAIADRITRSPSLHDFPARCLDLAYHRARRDAMTDTGFPLTTFPEACPWPLTDVLTDDWWPPEAP